MASYHLSMKTDSRPSGTKIKSADHIDYIYRLGKYKDYDKKVKAAKHTDYINRESNYEKKGGCVYKACHLPSWAKNSPQTFFAAADRCEAPTRVRYREIEFALPNELSLAQNKEIVREFINCHLKDFYYAYAIHEKPAAIENSERNIHVHIMFSERKLDDIEKTQERRPEIFFKKANPKNPFLGGAKKDSRWNGSYRARHLHQVRLDCARIQNKILKKYGHGVTVDSRTLKLQWDEAKAKGDLNLAALLDRPPEEHLGPAAADPNHPKVILLKKYRAFKLQQQKLIEAADALQQTIQQDQTELSLSQSLKDSSEALKNVQAVTASGKLEKLKKEIATAAKDLADAKNNVIYYYEARALARYELLTPQERALEREAAAIKADILQLENMKKPFSSSNHKDSFAAAESEILSAQIEQNNQRLKSLALDLQAINRKFTEKEMKSKLTKMTRNILAKNQPNEKKALEFSRRLDELVKEMQALISTQLKKQDEVSKTPAYTAKEMKGILNPLLSRLQAELQNIQRDSDFLVKNLISYGRAYEMAKNVYVKGGYKLLREQKRELEKEARQIEAAFDERQRFACAFSQLPAPKWYHSSKSKQVYAGQKKSLEDMDRSLALRKYCLNLKTEKLEKDFAALEKSCNTSYAKEQIEKITAGILAKNRPYTQELDEKMARSKELKEQILDLKNLIKGVDKQVKIDRRAAKQIQYTVKRTSPHPISARPIPPEILPPAVRLIAKALNQDPKAAALVARIVDFEEIDYNALSELDKKLFRAKMQ